MGPVRSGPSGLGSLVLRPVEPSDMSGLYRWATDLEDGYRWRFGGSTPSPEQFGQALWTDVLCHYVLVDEGAAALRSDPKAYVACYGANLKNGYAYIGVQGPRVDGVSLAPMVGILQLIEHVFNSWPFRKLYAEVPEFNVESLKSALDLMRVEGRLTDHVWARGRFWDELIVVLERDVWLREIRPRFTKVLRSNS